MPKRVLSVVVLFFGLCACGEADPEERNNDVVDEPIQGAVCSPAVGYDEDVSACEPLTSDYQPRQNGSADDAWDACISDDNTYHQIEASVSTIARVEAFEAIADLLWRKQPTHEDFAAARLLYEEAEGISSRVSRRYDIHYPPPAEGGCEDAGVAAANPDYCVGPAFLQPILVEAFAQGSLGKDLVVNAARIQAALQWFFYVSVLKEAKTCTDTPKDCDSSWAYYAGGTERGEPIGLAAYIDSLAPETHDRVYDGLLAVRCWKNLDNETGTSEDLALRDQAIAQTDAALMRGMAVLVQQKVREYACTSGDYKDATSAWLFEVIVPLFAREWNERDATLADDLLASLEAGEPLDTEELAQRIETAFACP